jgi:hypothetical protein
MTTNSVLRFTAPKIALDVPDWPAGRERVFCRFRIRRNSQGQERAEKQILGGRLRFSPWGTTVRIVDGSDGTHYVIGQRKSGCVFLMDNGMREVVYMPFDCPTFREIVKALK